MVARYPALDEVAELSLSAQAALLRVLQERKLERIGGTRSIPVDRTSLAGTYHDQLNSAKRSIIHSALEQTGKNFYEAARLLDVHPTYLYRLAANRNIPSE